MNHNDAIKLEHLLLGLIEQKRGKKLARLGKHDGVTIDSDSFEDDTNAIKGLWLAVELLDSK
jgi:hypothetical protein